MSSYTLEVKNLTIDFFKIPIFQDLSFKVPEKHFFAILGPNGSGKSSLIRAILGLIRPTSGTISIGHKQPKQVPFGWIGYVPQIKTLDRTFPGQSSELVMTGLKPSWPWKISKQNKEKIEATLEEVGAAHLIHKPIGKLSGGELQRVYLARCLIRQPKILLLDEPLTGVDPGLQDNFYTILANIRQTTQSTIVMVTHDLTITLQQIDLVLMINQNIHYFGSPYDVLTEEHLKTVFGYGNVSSFLKAER